MLRNNFQATSVVFFLFAPSFLPLGQILPYVLILLEPVINFVQFITNVWIFCWFYFGVLLYSHRLLIKISRETLINLNYGWIGLFYFLSAYFETKTSRRVRCVPRLGHTVTNGLRILAFISLPCFFLIMVWF